MHRYSLARHSCRGDTVTVEKVLAFAIVKYDDYLEHHDDVDVGMLIKVVKVYEDEDAANREAERLNALKQDHPSRYWVVGTKLMRT